MFVASATVVVASFKGLLVLAIRVLEEEEVSPGLESFTKNISHIME